MELLDFISVEEVDLPAPDQPAEVVWDQEQDASTVVLEVGAYRIVVTGVSRVKVPLKGLQYAAEIKAKTLR